MLGLTLKETGVYRDIKAEVLEESRLNTADMVIALLEKRFDSISEDGRNTIKTLSLPVLKDLNLAVLDFASADDLHQWLEENQAEAD